MFESVINTLSRTNKFIVIDEAEWLKDKTLDMLEIFGKSLKHQLF